MAGLGRLWGVNTREDPREEMNGSQAWDKASEKGEMYVSRTRRRIDTPHISI